MLIYIYMDSSSFSDSEILLDAARGATGVTDFNKQYIKPGAGDAPLPFVDPGASPDGTPQEVPLGIPTPVAVDDSAELAASRARVETLRREVDEQRRRADDALARVATSERATHAERERANTAEAARVEGAAAFTDADRRHRTELSTAERRREEAELRLSEMLGLPDDRQWRCLLGCAACPAGSIAPATFVRQAICQEYGFFLGGGEMVVAVRDGPDATDANLRVGAAWARRSADIILGPVPGVSGPVPVRGSAGNDVESDVRVLSVIYDSAEERYRSYESAVNAFVEDDFGD